MSCGVLRSARTRDRLPGLTRVRYLVTGGAGFIGSHLSDFLLARGHTVHVIDDLSTGNLENIRHLAGRPDFECTVGSAADAELVHEAAAGADAIFHLAAAVGVELVVDSPVRTIETNVHCTEVVLAAAAAAGTPVLVTSTSEVYGKSRELPYRETSDLSFGATSTGRWAYACSKAIDEFLALAYWKERRLPAVVARLFNTVGPRQTGQYGMVVPRFVDRALRGTPLTVYGDGTQSRCFCHVRDVVVALYDLLACEDAYGGVFNVGSTDEISILDLAHRVVALTDSRSPIALIPLEEAYRDGFEDMSRRVPDVSKAERVIGWRARRSLEEIVHDVAAYQTARWEAVQQHRVGPTDVLGGAGALQESWRHPAS